MLDKGIPRFLFFLFLRFLHYGSVETSLVPIDIGHQARGDFRKYRIEEGRSGRGGVEKEEGVLSFLC